MPAQKYEVGKRAAEYGVTATIHHYWIKYPDLVLKESSVRRFKNTYQERIKLNLDCLSAAGLESPGFAKELSNKKTGRPLATQWRGNKSVNTDGITDLADLSQEKLYRDYVRCTSWVTRRVLFYKEVLFRQWEHFKRLYIRGIPSPHLIL